MGSDQTPGDFWALTGRVKQAADLRHKDNLNQAICTEAVRATMFSLGLAKQDMPFCQPKTGEVLPFNLDSQDRIALLRTSNEVSGENSRIQYYRLPRPIRDEWSNSWAPKEAGVAPG